MFPFERAWSSEKTACVDWASAEDVVAHHFTLLCLLDFHEKLRAHLASLPPGQQQDVKDAFLERSDAALAKQRTLIGEWNAAGLLTPRAARWCRQCGCEGHTLISCTKRHAFSDVLLKFEQHRAFLEKRKLALEKGKPSRKNETLPGNDGAASRATHESAPPPAFDEWYKGVVTEVTPEQEKAVVQVAGFGQLLFFFDRCDYHFIKVVVGDEVKLRVEFLHERPVAVDVAPLNRTFSIEDVKAFVRDCEATTKPITRMKFVLMQPREWDGLLALAMEDQNRAVGLNLARAVTVMTNFLPNRSPVHIPVLGSFLELLSTAGPVSGRAFFPDLFTQALLTNEEIDENAPWAADMLLELCDFVVLLQRHTRVVSSSATVFGRLHTMHSTIEERLTNSGRLSTELKRKLSQAAKYLAASQESAQRILIPSGPELSRPPSLPDSAFSPANLPVNVTTQYSCAAEYVAAQSQLLRADTFTAVARILGPACGFHFADYEVDEQTQSDIEHARVYDQVEYLGRTVSRDWDYTKCYLLRVKPRSPNINWKYAMPRAQLLCFTTGLTRDRIEDDEIFWGIVAAVDPALHQQGVIVVHPCCSDLEKLVAQLERNAALDKKECSVVMETSVFFHGYAPVMRAMGQFLGPRPMALPFEKAIVGELPLTPPTSNHVVEYVPPFAATFYRGIVNSIEKRLVLDPGQEQAMHTLPDSPVMLIQGPPGTGKSFIGCRLVEAYVRFKQSIDTKTILSAFDVSLLPSCDEKALLPPIGPVVVITYKNHALDEFLVDLRRCGLWGNDCFSSDKHPIVRLGGGSQEEDLQVCSINSIMSSSRVGREVMQAKRRVASLTKRCEAIAMDIRALEQGEVSRSQLQSWMTREQQTTFRYENLGSWLAGDNYTGIVLDAVSPLLYVQLLRSSLPSGGPKQSPSVDEDEANDIVQSLPTLNDEEADDDEAQLSVFAAMRREFVHEYRDSGLVRNCMVSKEALQLASVSPVPIEGIPSTLQSLWSLSPSQRHQYLAFLLKSAISKKTTEYRDTSEALDRAVVLYNHARDEARLNILRSSDIVGITTTGCAIFQHLLRDLAPSLLVVEEAAEVLESQLIACMTDSLKQIILIGDHFQLQPKVETLLLEKVNHMNVSLFQRLSNKMPPISLVEQRRMCPSIANLIRPFYRQTLTDHPSVISRSFVDVHGNAHSQGVPGLACDVFLWIHTHPEEVAAVGRSKVNKLELVMVANLVRHLLSCGVKTSSITVITPYLGQRRAIAYELQGLGPRTAEVRVSTVDRFQGDENDVVILSLVRTARLTEFLRLRNRMIVSCSRARFAMVMMGNEELLRKSSHWNQLLDILCNRNCIGAYLPIKTSQGIMTTVTPNTPFADWPTRKRPREDKK